MRYGFKGIEKPFSCINVFISSIKSKLQYKSSFANVLSAADYAAPWGN